MWEAMGHLVLTLFFTANSQMEKANAKWERGIPNVVIKMIKIFSFFFFILVSMKLN